MPEAPLTGAPMVDLAKDVLPGIDKAVELGIADPDRVGVMGQSFGGYNTLSLIVQSNRFKAAIMFAGFGDLVSAFGSMRADGSMPGVGWIEDEDGMMDHRGNSASAISRIPPSSIWIGYRRLY